MSGEVRMTRSRAKRQQQRQVEILIDICHRKFSAHWDQYDDDACTRMMVMDIYDAALGEAGREVPPAGQSLLSFWEFAAATAQQFWQETALRLSTHKVTLHLVYTPHFKCSLLTYLWPHIILLLGWVSVFLLQGINQPIVPLFQQFQLEDAGAGDMETVEPSSSDELISKTNGSIDPSLTAEEGLR